MLDELSNFDAGWFHLFTRIYFPNTENLSIWYVPVSNGLKCLVVFHIISLPFFLAWNVLFLSPIGLHCEWKAQKFRRERERVSKIWCEVSSLTHSFSFVLEHWKCTICNVRCCPLVLLPDRSRSVSLYLAGDKGFHDPPSGLGTWLGHHDLHQISCSDGLEVSVLCWALPHAPHKGQHDAACARMCKFMDQKAAACWKSRKLLVGLTLHLCFLHSQIVLTFCSQRLVVHRAWRRCSRCSLLSVYPCGVLLCRPYWCSLSVGRYVVTVDNIPLSSFLPLDRTNCFLSLAQTCRCLGTSLM